MPKPTSKQIQAEIEHLRRARKNIEKGHTKGLFARDAVGNPVSPESPNAACYCILGAFRSTEDGLTTEASERAQRRFAYMAGVAPIFWAIGLFNDRDETMQQTILALLDKAIEEAEKELPQ